jgi:hypothetical protein
MWQQLERSWNDGGPISNAPDGLAFVVERPAARTWRGSSTDAPPGISLRIDQCYRARIQSETKFPSEQEQAQQHLQHDR